MTVRPQLQEIIDLFADSPRDLRLELLLDYSRRLPELPAHLAEHPELLQPVPECQTPFFLAAEDQGDGVALYFSAPPEAPTTRGYAAILSEGLSGGSSEEILGTPSDFYTRMGLNELISPLRLRGMSAILGRIKRAVVEIAEASAQPG